MRLLNDEEIRIMYKQDYKKLVPYEFWRIYLNADNDSTRESDLPTGTGTIS